MNWPEGTIKHYIDENRFSCPGYDRRVTLLSAVHSVGVPGQHPLDTMSYWDSLKNQNATDDRPDEHRSAPCVIHWDGQIYAASDANRVMYHLGGSSYTDFAKQHWPKWTTNQYTGTIFQNGKRIPIWATPNEIAIGIEFSHRSKDGRPTSDQEDAFVSLMTVWNIQVTMHTLITGKRDAQGYGCHRWYIDHMGDWHKLVRKIHASRELIR